MDMKKIVVIDDEPDFCSIVKDMLTGTGLYEVFTACDGYEGLGLCLKEPPDVIFLDYILSGKTGEQMIHILQAHPKTSNIPVVLMSGLGEVIYFEKMALWKWLSADSEAKKMPAGLNNPLWEQLPSALVQKLGVKIYLPKPFTRATLLEVMQNVFQNVQERNKG